MKNRKKRLLALCISAALLSISACQTTSSSSESSSPPSSSPPSSSPPSSSSSSSPPSSPSESSSQSSSESSSSESSSSESSSSESSSSESSSSSPGESGDAQPTISAGGVPIPNSRPSQSRPSNTQGRSKGEQGEQGEDGETRDRREFPGRGDASKTAAGDESGENDDLSFEGGETAGDGEPSESEYAEVSFDDYQDPDGDSGDNAEDELSFEEPSSSTSEAEQSQEQSAAQTESVIPQQADPQINDGMSEEEKLAVLEGWMDQSMVVFDDSMLEERERILNRDNATGRANSAEEADVVTLEDFEDMYGTPNPAPPGSETGSGTGQIPDIEGGPRAGDYEHSRVNFPPPTDIPDGSDDDVVARQLREAAMREADPELREKLWQEYRKYKNQTQRG